MVNDSWSVVADDLPSLHVARSGVLRFLREHGEQHADYDACALALSELLSNALRHGPGGTITVTLDWTKARPHLAVHDAGPGFALRIALPPGSSEGGRGLFLISALIGPPGVCVDERGCTVSVVLPVERRSEAPTVRKWA